MNSLLSLQREILTLKAEITALRKERALMLQSSSANNRERAGMASTIKRRDALIATLRKEIERRPRVNNA